MFTANRPLLLACVYFDQTHTGYILDKDLEDIIHILGLQLSRAQVSKLVARCLTKNQFLYRKLTDRPVVKEEGKAAAPDIYQAYYKETDDRSLASGNLLVMGKAREMRLGTAERLEESGDSNIVMVNGNMVDVNSVLSNLSRSEKARSDTENRLKTVEDETTMLRASLTATEQSCQKLTKDLDAARRQLHDQHYELLAVQTNAQTRSSLLSRTSATLSALVTDINSILMPSMAHAAEASS